MEVNFIHLKDDPSETQNLAATFPEKLSELDQAYQSWWQSIVASGKLKLEPIRLGLRKDEIVELKPHHGKKEGHIQFTGKRGLTGERIGTHPSGVDGDWLAGWRDSTDKISWDVHFQEGASYEFGIKIRWEEPLPPVQWIFATSKEVHSSTQQFTEKFSRLDLLHVGYLFG